MPCRRSGEVHLKEHCHRAVPELGRSPVQGQAVPELGRSPVQGNGTVLTLTTKYEVKSEKKITLNEVLAEDTNKYVEAKLIKILGNLIFNSEDFKTMSQCFHYLPLGTTELTLLPT